MLIAYIVDKSFILWTVCSHINTTVIIRFLREPNTEAGRYYSRVLKRKLAKQAEIERVKQEAERVERERLAQERLKQEQQDDADGESDDEKDELKKFQKRVMCSCLTLFVTQCNIHQGVETNWYVIVY